MGSKKYVCVRENRLLGLTLAVWSCLQAVRSRPTTLSSIMSPSRSLSTHLPCPPVQAPVSARNPPRIPSQSKAETHKCRSCHLAWLSPVGQHQTLCTGSPSASPGYLQQPPLPHLLQVSVQCFFCLVFRARLLFLLCAHCWFTRTATLSSNNS